MATQKIQTSAIFDHSSVANYKTTSQVIGNALTTLGWVLDNGATWVSGGNYLVNNLVLYSGTTYICIQTATGRTTAPSSDTSYWTATAGDAYAVNWSNVVLVPPYNSVGASLQTPNPRGAWVSTGTAYAQYDMVTNGGLTYQALSDVASLAVTQAIQNTTISARNIQSIGAAGAGTGGNVTIYTYLTDSSATNAWVGYLFTVINATNPLNNGTFICTASTATSLTLSNAAGVAQAGVAGTSSSSSANIGYIGSFGTIGGGNQQVGQSMLFSGFVASSGANNGALVLTASATTCAGGVKTGVSETISATMINVTAPALDTLVNSGVGSAGFHWTPYNFEIWVSQGPLSTTAPVYLKLIYTYSNSGYLQIVMGIGTGQVNGVLNGNLFNSGTPLTLTNAASASDKGGLTYECSFCGTADKVSWILWRQAGTAYCSVVSIDRAHDQNGADLDTYTTVLMATGAAGSYQILFKPGVGGAVPLTPNTKWPCINDGNASSAYNGMAPPYLCFPMPGYMANPVLGAIAMHSGDMNEGSLINTIMYGTSHTFLMTANLATGATLAASSAAGIQWEEF